MGAGQGCPGPRVSDTSPEVSRESGSSKVSGTEETAALQLLLLPVPGFATVSDTFRGSSVADSRTFVCSTARGGPLRFVSDGLGHLARAVS